MDIPDLDSATDALTTALSGPARVSGDAGSVDSHRITDLIAAHQYLSAVAAANTRSRGLRYNRLIPGGTVGRVAIGNPRYVILPSTFDRLGY